jgi:hypothetical protein
MAMAKRIVAMKIVTHCKQYYYQSIVKWYMFRTLKILLADIDEDDDDDDDDDD